MIDWWILPLILSVLIALVMFVESREPRNAESLTIEVGVVGFLTASAVWLAFFIVLLLT